LRRCDGSPQPAVDARAHDFNQRNVGFGPGVVAFDREIVALNTAHRDLLEMLTFALSATAGCGRRSPP